MRGINVGGKNKVPMADRRQHLEELGFSNGTTYRASGTVMLKSDKRAREITARIENALLKRCTRDDGRIRVEVLTRKHHNAVIDHGLRGFGEQPEHYHSDARFLMGTDSAQAIPVFNPREGVNTIWPGDGVICSQRLRSKRTKSRLNTIIATPEYTSMTIRSWSTTRARTIKKQMPRQA